MKKKETLKVTVILLTLLLMPTIGCAKSSGRDKRQGPPPEAVEACEGKSAGDSVTFTGRRGESLEAICREIDGQLAAVPEGMPHSGGHPE